MRRIVDIIVTALFMPIVLLVALWILAVLYVADRLTR